MKPQQIKIDWTVSINCCKKIKNLVTYVEVECE